MQSEKMGMSAEEAKALVATTQATLQKQAEEQAMRATTDQVIADEAPDDQVYNNETPNPLNISATQPPSLVDITQSSSTVLFQMLGEETWESSRHNLKGLYQIQPLSCPTS